MPPSSDLASLGLQLELVGRIILAFILGGVIGFERERVQRPAGLRTHMLVAVGSAAFTIASAYAFTGLGTQHDPTRIAAQIVTGVGFLGAGTIFRTPSTIRGLTTAASIWLVAAIGLLTGAGLYLLAVLATLLGFVALYWLRPPSRRLRNDEPSVGEEEAEEDTHE